MAGSIPGGPNVLLVMCDQLSALATGAYGNRSVLTPNIDSLAAEGVTFGRNYCNAPLCAPSRASMFTGLLASEIPVNDNGEELPAATPTFAHVLRREGYATVLSGKMHFVGPDQFHGLEERLTTDIYPSDFWWTNDWRAQGVPPRPAGGGDHIDHPPSSEMIRSAGPQRTTYQVDYDEEVHFRALERLRQFSRRRGPDARVPWFLCVSYIQPHAPYAPTDRYWDRYHGRDIALPQPPPAGSTTHVTDWWLSTYHELDIGTLTADDVYRTRRASYAMTSCVDDKLGELVDELDQLGLRQDTVVIFTSDHGDMLGEHGMFFKRTLREWSARVPLIVAGPGVEGGGRRVDQVTSLVDLFPTIINLAGLELPDASFVERLRGASLLPLLGGGPEDLNRAVIMENNGEGTVSPIRAAVSRSAKYIATVGHPDQLYDLVTDPDEWHNVAEDPSRHSLGSSLAEHCTAGWDGEAMKASIEESQQRRRYLQQARMRGVYQPWDAEPTFDAARMYLRHQTDNTWNRSWTYTPDAGAGGR